MRSLATLFLVLLLFATLASAQTPTAGNVFFGYSYDNTNFSSIGRANLNGWEGSLEGKIFPAVGIVADFTGHYGSQNFVNPSNTCAIGVVCPPLSLSSHLYEALFGPRFSVSFGKFRPFTDFEFGVGHVNTNTRESQTCFVNAIGGGLDYRIIRPIAWRFQGDIGWTHFYDAYQTNVRLSTGIVVRF